MFPHRHKRLRLEENFMASSPISLCYRWGNQGPVWYRKLFMLTYLSSVKSVKYLTFPSSRLGSPLLYHTGFREPRSSREGSAPCKAIHKNAATHRTRTNGHRTSEQQIFALIWNANTGDVTCCFSLEAPAKLPLLLKFRNFNSVCQGQRI